jgi:hypothetical protein
MSSRDSVLKDIRLQGATHSSPCALIQACTAWMIASGPGPICPLGGKSLQAIRGLRVCGWLDLFMRCSNFVNQALSKFKEYNSHTPLNDKKN